MDIGFDPTAVRTSAEGPEFRVGTRMRWQDNDFANDGANVQGDKEFLYVQAGEAITGLGYLCVVDSDCVAEMADTTSTAPGAGAGARCGAAQAAMASGGYGWLQIYGRGSLRTLASAALGTELTSSATPGAVDDATTSGLEVISGLTLGTATGGSEATNDDAYFNYPYVGRTL